MILHKLGLLPLMSVLDIKYQMILAPNQTAKRSNKITKYRQINIKQIKEINKYKITTSS